MLFIVLIFMASCSKKFQEYNSFGGSAPVRQEHKKLDEKSSHQPTLIDKNENLADINMNTEYGIQASKVIVHHDFKKPQYAAVTPLKGKSNTSKNIPKNLCKQKCKNLEFMVNKTFPAYTNISIVLGILSVLVGLGVLFQGGVAEAFHILRYGGHGKIVEVLCWIFLGFLQFTFGTWMKYLKENQSFGKGLVFLLHFLLTIIIAGFAILLAMF